jgi:glyoxylase I family protein
VIDSDLRDRLLGYELALARRDPAAVDGDLVDLLTDDFLEFGQSGRVWTRETIAPLLGSSPDGSAGAAAPEGGAAAPELEAFEVTRLGEGVALVTYRAHGTNRSSIWVRRDGRWRMRFHQGTPLPGDVAG